MKNLKKVDNSLYKATISIGASTLKQVLWYFINIFFFKNSLNVFSSLKVFLLKLFGAKIGSGTVVKPSVNIKYPWKLRVGKNVWIGEETWIDNLSDVIIGDNVTLSQGALLLTGSHDFTKESFDFLSYPITLEEGVWICSKAIVGPGTVTCKSHSMLTTGSVANKIMKEYTIYAGNPAKAVGERIII